MSHSHGGRLSMLQAALVVARRDFGAILFSRSFFFFLLGPLFPVIVAVAASSVGHKVQDNITRTTLGVAMPGVEADALVAAGKRLGARLGDDIPELAIVRRASSGASIDAPALLRAEQGRVVAVISGSLGRPVLTGPAEQIAGWRGPVALIAAEARAPRGSSMPEVAEAPIAAVPAINREGQLRTGQAGQMLLFLLTMLLAGMVLSNLVEEKANKIIEVLAAAVPMDAVFYGKLFAMLGVSFVGIAVWGSVFGGVALAGGHSLAEMTPPAVGWNAFIALGIAYFAMAYLLLGSVFLTIGSMAATVREVQTLSMPVSMAQLMVFFFATFAAAVPGTMLALSAEVLPFSSPFAMLGRAANDSAIAPHLAALAWQALWVAVFVRLGARLFRRRVLKSGPQRVRKAKRRLRAA